MKTCWEITKQRGFLINPEPVHDLLVVENGFDAERLAVIQGAANVIATLLRTQQLRTVLETLPLLDVEKIVVVEDQRVIERLFQIYAHFANVYVWYDNDNSSHFIPRAVAVPLVALADACGRPPILSYTHSALVNWRLIDPDSGITIDNTDIIQAVVGLPDEAWFHRVHIEIEAQAGEALDACERAQGACAQNDDARLEQLLTTVANTTNAMSKTFRRMTKGCSPDVYFHTQRPYLFGFTDVVYEGVDKYGGKPQTISGQTGAQSAVIPALRSYLGIMHSQGGLSEYLVHMNNFRPKPHQHYLNNIDHQTIRDYVKKRQLQSLTDIYNGCLEAILNFRKLHLGMAKLYVADRVENPKGTGGTDFMHWLGKITQESAEQFL